MKFSNIFNILLYYFQNFISISLTVFLLAQVSHSGKLSGVPTVKKIRKKRQKIIEKETKNNKNGQEFVNIFIFLKCQMLLTSDRT